MGAGRRVGESGGGPDHDPRLAVDEVEGHEGADAAARRARIVGHAVVGVVADEVAAERGVVERVGEVEASEGAQGQVQHVPRDHGESAAGRHLGRIPRRGRGGGHGVGGDAIKERLVAAREADRARVPGHEHGVGARGQRVGTGPERMDGVLRSRGDVIAHEPVPGRKEEYVGIGGMPVHLLDVGGRDRQGADERVGPSVVEFVPPPDVIKDHLRLVGVPGRRRGVHGLDDGVSGGGTHGGDPSDAGPELGIDDRLAERGLGEGGRGVGRSVTDEALTEVGPGGGHGEESDGDARGGERSENRAALREHGRSAPFARTGCLRRRMEVSARGRSCLRPGGIRRFQRRAGARRLPARQWIGAARAGGRLRARRGG